MKVYYERIRELREDSDKTQQFVADYLGVAQRTYSDYESGKTRIPVERLIKLASLYNVSMDYISGTSNTRGEYPSF